MLPVDGGGMHCLLLDASEFLNGFSVSRFRFWAFWQPVAASNTQVIPATTIRDFIDGSPRGKPAEFAFERNTLIAGPFPIDFEQL